MIKLEKGSIVLGNGKRFPLTQMFRHLIQLFAFLLLPGLFLSVFSALRDLFVSLIQGTFSFAAQAPGIITLAAVTAVTALWGRFFCGYLCSFGAAQEFLAFAAKKLTGKRRSLPGKADRILKYLKYAVLAVIVLGIWTLQLPVDGTLSPWGVFGMLLSGNGEVMLSAVPTAGFAILTAILAASFFFERFFCRYLCPLGALFTPLSRGRLFRIRRKETVCSGCRQCSRVCAMGVTVHENDRVTSGECIDCMRCMDACVPEALRANPHPAIAGTASALVLCGVLGVSRNIPAGTGTEQAAIQTVQGEPSGRYEDGVYTGSGTGFRGEIRSSVTVMNGMISDITVLSSRDDADYFSRAQSGVIGAILSFQTPEVDAVSGATFSSYGIMESVADALELPEVKTSVEQQAQDAGKSRTRTSKHRSGSRPEGQDNGSGNSEGNRGKKDRGENAPAKPGSGRKAWGSRKSGNNAPSEKESSGNGNKDGSGNTGRNPGSGTQEGILQIAPETMPETAAETSKDSAVRQDGVYTGTGTGYRGETDISVTVEDGKITDITVLSYADDRQYFSRAAEPLITAILNSQSLEVGTVSGATFSSNGILEAVADALGETFTNPNASTGGHGRH